MTIGISIHNKDGNVKTRTFKISTDMIIKSIAYLGVFNFFGREAMRIRPPRRGAGAIVNYMTAAIITDAVMNLAYPKKKSEKKVEEEIVFPPSSRSKEVMYTQMEVRSKSVV